MTPQKIVCVLGMHRSGTSALTRVLNILGAYLGPESMWIPPADDNPTGFWEFEPFVRINRSILKRFGGSSMNPPNFADGWEVSPSFNDLREQAISVIAAQFSGSCFWAWKDPRACLTLSFWQQILPGMDYVFCVRHPGDVAASLKRRNGIAETRSIYLWLLYNRAVLANCNGKHIHVMTYENLMSAPVFEAERVATFLQTAAAPGSGDAIMNFIDPERRHHHSAGISRRDRSTRVLQNSAQAAAEAAYRIMAQTDSIQFEVLIALMDEALDAIDRDVENFCGDHPLQVLN